MRKVVFKRDGSVEFVGFEPDPVSREIFLAMSDHIIEKWMPESSEKWAINLFNRREEELTKEIESIRQARKAYEEAVPT
jgi:hypothetical protein